MSKFIVKVWETEHDRDMGECDSSYFDTLDEALAKGKAVEYFLASKSWITWLINSFREIPDIPLAFFKVSLARCIFSFILEVSLSIVSTSLSV